MTTLRSLLFFVWIAVTVIMILSISDRFVQGSRVGSSSSFLTYENPDYNLKIKVPPNWTVGEENLTSPYIVRIIPNDFLAERTSPVGIYIVADSPPPDRDTLSEWAANTESLFEAAGRLGYLRYIDSTNTTLSGMPAYSISYYDFTNSTVTPIPNLKVTETTMFVPYTSGNVLFTVQYYAEPKYFDKYLHESRKAIESFQITNE